MSSLATPEHQSVLINATTAFVALVEEIACADATEETDSGRAIVGLNAAVHGLLIALDGRASREDLFRVVGVALGSLVAQDIHFADGLTDALADGLEIGVKVALEAEPALGRA